MILKSFEATSGLTRLRFYPNLAQHSPGTLAHFVMTQFLFGKSMGKCPSEASLKLFNPFEPLRPASKASPSRSKLCSIDFMDWACADFTFSVARLRAAS